MTITSSHTNALAPEEDGPPTVTDVLWWVRREGIRLTLTESKDGITAGPKHLLTDDFREAVRALNPWLIRHLLAGEALAHYARQIRQTGDVLDSPRAAAGYSAMAENSTRLDDIWDEADLGEFRDELRQWLKAGLAAHRDAGRERRISDQAAYVETTDDGPQTTGEQAPEDFTQEEVPEGQISLLNAAATAG